MVRSSIPKEIIMLKPALIVRGLVLVSVVAVLPSAALAGKKCHRCDFSDEPIIVVGTKPSNNEPVAPGLKPLRATPAATLPPLKTAQPRPSLPKVLGTGKPGVAELQLHCNTISLCNDLIAHCHANGGQWVPGTNEGPQGEPASGDCFID
jgi:hypothetical protein